MPGLFDLSEFDFQVYADGRLGTMLRMSTTRVWCLVGTCYAAPKIQPLGSKSMTMRVECAEGDLVSHWYKRGWNILLMFLQYQYISPAS